MPISFYYEPPFTVQAPAYYRTGKAKALSERMAREAQMRAQQRSIGANLGGQVLGIGANMMQGALQQQYAMDRMAAEQQYATDRMAAEQQYNLDQSVWPLGFQNFGQFTQAAQQKGMSPQDYMTWLTAGRAGARTRAVGQEEIMLGLQQQAMQEAMPQLQALEQAAMAGAVQQQVPVTTMDMIQPISPGGALDNIIKSSSGAIAQKAQTLKNAFVNTMMDPGLGAAEKMQALQPIMRDIQQLGGLVQGQAPLNWQTIQQKGLAGPVENMPNMLWSVDKGGVVKFTHVPQETPNINFADPQQVASVVTQLPNGTYVAKKGVTIQQPKTNEPQIDLTQPGAIEQHVQMLPDGTIVTTKGVSVNRPKEQPNQNAHPFMAMKPAERMDDFVKFWKALPAKETKPNANPLGPPIEVPYTRDEALKMWYETMDGIQQEVDRRTGMAPTPASQPAAQQAGPQQYQVGAVYNVRDKQGVVRQMRWDGTKFVEVQL